MRGLRDDVEALAEAKRLQLLKETIPRLAWVAVLGNPATPYHPKAVEDLKTVAPFEQPTKIELVVNLTHSYGGVEGRDREASPIRNERPYPRQRMSACRKFDRQLRVDSRHAGDVP